VVAVAFLDMEQVMMQCATTAEGQVNYHVIRSPKND